MEKSKESKTLLNLQFPFKNSWDVSSDHLTFEINNVIEAYNDLRSYGEKTADEDIIKFFPNGIPLLDHMDNTISYIKL